MKTTFSRRELVHNGILFIRSTIEFAIEKSDIRILENADRTIIYMCYMEIISSNKCKYLESVVKRVRQVIKD